ncbi:MAG: universal stress protein [Thermoanaerobaculia bacterium]|jgi:nucleotide-binding universal stress UspA family protein
MASAPLSVLVPIDFSSASLKALRQAGTLADRMRAPLTILHVRPLSDVAAAIAEGREDLLKGTSRALAATMKRHYTEKLAALAARSGAVEARLASGRASREIVKAARGFDLVVMGRTGRGGITGLLGGTTRKVLASSPIPVVVVPA